MLFIHVGSWVTRLTVHLAKEEHGPAKTPIYSPALGHETIGQARIHDDETYRRPTVLY